MKLKLILQTVLISIFALSTITALGQTYRNYVPTGPGDTTTSTYNGLRLESDDNDTNAQCANSDLEEVQMEDANGDPLYIDATTGDLTTVSTGNAPYMVIQAVDGIRCCGDGYLDAANGEECDVGVMRNGRDTNVSASGAAGAQPADNLQDYGCSYDCEINTHQGWSCNDDCTDFVQMHRTMTRLYGVIIYAFNTNQNGTTYFCMDPANKNDAYCQSFRRDLDLFKSYNKHVGICNTVRAYYEGISAIPGILPTGYTVTDFPDLSYPNDPNLFVEVNFTDCSNISCNVDPSESRFDVECQNPNGPQELLAGCYNSPPAPGSPNAQIYNAIFTP